MRVIHKRRHQAHVHVVIGIVPWNSRAWRSNPCGGPCAKSRVFLMHFLMPYMYICKRALRQSAPALSCSLTFFPPFFRKSPGRSPCDCISNAPMQTYQLLVSKCCVGLRRFISLGWCLNPETRATFRLWFDLLVEDEEHVFDVCTAGSRGNVQRRGFSDDATLGASESARKGFMIPCRVGPRQAQHFCLWFKI